MEGNFCRQRNTCLCTIPVGVILIKLSNDSWPIIGKSLESFIPINCFRYCSNDDNDNDQEGYDILHGSLELFVKQFFESSHCDANINFSSYNQKNYTLNGCSISSSSDNSGSSGCVQDDDRDRDRDNLTTQ